MSPNGDMKPTQPELLILKHLWKTEPQSLREIHLAVERKLNWSRSSTRKTVERMCDKNMLSSSDSHGLKVYRAALKKVPTMASIIRHFTAEVLGLEGPMPVSNLVQSDLFNEQELDELSKYLEQIQRTSENDEPC